ncbi:MULTISPECIES: MupG family TIM beta-alpha barrel fold protein [unclassified Enterococcus]|uniref:DUF871 domain-containing protein n=1 Tax=unclassified Enterococcus TaxID=2608891 RepID=UPI0015544226|nr:MULTISPECIES: MupG family TIM beta-alpha barrel fold protein [unclassified Enterococcus]MBS7577037.1 DUF871 domain-containing protein [Enterococcus sp. MMGLQ5-2]MBS7584516.1 DUF871 domain-containing protein [Enterococcus sp. MMGLQ5-1]NPD12371.1 DUF871 domain-containing protein [Enterococcus sp. MMGLQ5-1]NPD36871.1 DUF871 domain-containing protein [Enterococcus sp. MMGLQ5-2]
MKRRIGISVYPDHSDIEKDKAYIQKAANLGFSRIFMSMLEVKDGKARVAEKFKGIIQFAKKLGFETVLDIAPSIFKELGISYDDLSFFAELGADGIRLDEGFDGAKEAMLTYNPYGLAIELNMSNNVAYLEHILSYEANTPFLYGCHNFYPQRGTALPYDFFIECSRRFKRQGIKTAAFVTSQSGDFGPWDINDGLPTLEIHRDQPIELQAKHLFATDLIDDVIIGNAYASDEELAKLASIDRYKLSLSINYVDQASDIERKIVEDKQHFRRGDITAAMARSTQVRVKYSEIANPAHDNEALFERGDVVVGNDGFGKYKNELQIILEPHSDDRKNLVGRIPKSELALLEFLKPWTKFQFETKN